ncbi:glutathione S-transferase family protein [Saccharospirillum mangrovi]|uniref:glutathione S-transferase family protein n=1 Tax=Saccharospirillum mangrovi TaxID=2161747 RepID=UPI000D354DB0|nr:glutathione binding-like protein [Saccharospirillum mangrovi]
MIEVYAFATPNSVKVPIALEEMGLAYDLKPVNVRNNEQQQASFLALNPNGKVPVLVDREADDAPLVVTESAAILVYLAEKTGQLLPKDYPARAPVFEQLFFHASGLSPALGNAGFFKRYAAEPQPIAEARFSGEAERLLTLLDGRLATQPFVAGDNFTIADIVHFGWLWRRAFAEVTLDDKPNLSRWYDEIATRPAVVRAIARVEALIPKS